MSTETKTTKKTAGKEATKKAMVQMVESINFIDTVYYSTNIVISDNNNVSLNDEIVIEYFNDDDDNKKTQLYNKAELNAFIEAFEESFDAEDVKDFKDALKESADGVKADLLNQLKSYDLSVLCTPIKSNFIKIELNPLILLKNNNLHACNTCYNSLITLIEDINKSYKEYGKKLNKLVTLGLTAEVESFENKLEDVCNVSNYKKISSKLYELFEAFSISGKMLKATHIANGVFSIKTKKGVKKYEVDKNSLINCLNANIITMFQNASADDVGKYHNHYNELMSLQYEKIEAKKAAEDAKKESIKNSPLEVALQKESFMNSLKAGIYLNYFGIAYRVNDFNDTCINCYKFNTKSIKETSILIDKMNFDKISVITDETLIKELTARVTAEVMK